MDYSNYINNSNNNHKNNNPSYEECENYLQSNNDHKNKDDEDDNHEKIEELFFKEFEEKKEEQTKLKISNFKNTNANLEKINICIQNVNWHEINKNREDLIRHYELHQEGNRNDYEITEEEKQSKKNFSLNKQTDIFYTFSEFHLDIEPIYNHFQLRKNLIFISNREVVYFNQKGVEMLNIVNNKKTQLVFLKQDESDKVICFDAFKFEKDNNRKEFNNKKEFEVHFVFGKFNNRIVIIIIHFYEKLKKLVSEVIIKEEIIVSELQEQNQLINFVKFSDDKKFVYTSCNDSYIKIYDYENNMKLTSKYKSKNCVNHFSFNHSQNILAAVGDYEEVHLIDPKCGKTISYLKGHYDFNFVAKFKDNSDFILGTGNQDYSAKIWDLRKISEDMQEKNSFVKKYLKENFFRNLKNKLRNENHFKYNSLSIKGDYKYGYNNSKYVNYFKRSKFFWDFDDDEYNVFLNQNNRKVINEINTLNDIEIFNDDNKKEKDNQLTNIDSNIHLEMESSKYSNKSCVKTYFGVSNSIGDIKFIKDDFLLMLENTYNLHIVNLKDDKMQSIKYIGHGIGIDYNQQLDKIYLSLYQYNYSGIYAYKRISNFLEVMELGNSENNFTEVYENF